MRAVVVEGVDQDPQIIERDLPEPGPGEVRIDVAACGVCEG